MRKSLITTAIALSMFSLTAVQAQDSQGYLGLGAGWGTVAIDCDGVPQCDKTNTGYKLYGGYRFGSGWAVEGLYIDWGKATGTMTDTVLVSGKPITVTVDAKLRATGVGIGLAYFMPMPTDWNSSVRFGVISSKGKISLTGSGGGVTVSDSTSKSAAFAYFGLGAGYNLTPKLALMAEADFSRVKYGVEGEYETDDVRLISLGLRYSF